MLYHPIFQTDQYDHLESDSKPPAFDPCPKSPVFQGQHESKLKVVCEATLYFPPLRPCHRHETRLRVLAEINRTRTLKVLAQTLFPVHSALRDTGAHNRAGACVVNRVDEHRQRARRCGIKLESELHMLLRLRVAPEWNERQC